MIDYSILYKEELSIQERWPEAREWDLFVSAYNSSERVQKAFELASDAKERHWLIQPDYGYLPSEYPQGDVFSPVGGAEDEFIALYAQEAGLNDLTGLSVCLDITGFIKPYMMFFLRWLVGQGVRKIEVIFSEPGQYAKKEETRFSDESVTEVRQVAGFEGLHNPDDASDVLIIGAGYDDQLISQVAEAKRNSKKIQIFGFPSLRADMYQENILRAHRASEEVGVRPGAASAENFLAPANDPFVTASVIRQIVEQEAATRRGLSNLYLCPLATKAQALGFTLYYLNECIDSPVSMLFPFCRQHARETSLGLSRVWKYTLEFD